MRAVAVVVCGADGLVPLGGVPAVARAVDAVRPSVDHVVVLCGDAHPDVVRGALAGRAAEVRIGALRLPGADRDHVGERPDVPVGDGAPAELLVVHEAARPLAPAGLVAAVVAAVRDGHGSVVPVLPLVDTVKTVDPAGRVTGTPDRAGLVVVQTPQAFSAARAAGVLPALAAGHPPARAYTVAGAPVHTVPGAAAAAAAAPVRAAWERGLAQGVPAEGGGG